MNHKKGALHQQDSEARYLCSEKSLFERCSPHETSTRNPGYIGSFSNRCNVSSSLTVGTSVHAQIARLQNVDNQKLTIELSKSNLVA